MKLQINKNNDDPFIEHEHNSLRAQAKHVKNQITSLAKELSVNQSRRYAMQDRWGVGVMTNDERNTLNILNAKQDKLRASRDSLQALHLAIKNKIKYDKITGMKSPPITIW